MSKFPPVLITSLRLSFPTYLLAHSSWIIAKLNITLYFFRLGSLDQLSQILFCSKVQRYVVSLQLSLLNC